MSREEDVVSSAGLGESGAGLKMGCWVTGTVWGVGDALVDGFDALAVEDSDPASDARNRSSRVVLRVPAVDEGLGLADRALEVFCGVEPAIRWDTIDLRMFAFSANGGEDWRRLSGDWLLSGDKGLS